MIMCEECEAKFKIKCEDELPLKFCPYCGNPLHNDGEWETDEDEDE